MAKQKKHNIRLKESQRESAPLTGENTPPILPPALTAALCGMAAFAAFPPLGLWPLLFISLALPIRSAADMGQAGRAFRLGFIFGLFFFSATLHWLAATVQTFGGLPWPAALGALGLLAAYLALYPAFFFLFIHHLYRRKKNILLLAPAAWTALEFLRGHFFTGFPWAQLGHGLTGAPLLIQSADMGGAFLVSFAIIMVNTALAFPGKKGKNLAIPLSIWLCLGIYGHFRIKDTEQTIAQAPVIDVSILQGNLPPDQKWDPAFQRETLDRYHRLMEKAPEGENRLFLWPETATPFYLFMDTAPTRRILAHIKASGGYHLTGTPVFERDSHGKPHLFNTSYLISPQGDILARYDKQHLVPFGEYIPLKKLFPFMEKFIIPAGEFTPGTQPPVLAFQETLLAPLICFESVFPYIAREAVAKGAELLAVQTNDAWFGNTGGPAQHLAFSQFRAVEFRRAVIRSANTGISALILPTGRITEQTSMNTKAILSVQAPLLKEKSIYARFGDFFAWTCLFVVVFYFVAAALPVHRKGADRSA
ncbi:apolipoprotein N-acyltransferase [Desulfobotulus alkaliphilus]|uniref:Apolipoprotein N-acyltransferase n=1 Tax=Desulfobotulus alkaliphilus TaxID=622671 RepID=A0A562RZQ7_9BACT|nr:apolipoprotein N-acyltransferase [Desulfobotulus alkaliphilus]TWI73934.1 apolipoprotein N-acyltransferase [Desulfobotulus alkaliphilus]